jgi:ABC-type uncharacterized transport system permease subunit
MASLQWSTLLLDTVVLASPLLLAAIGGLASERSGVMNICLEGKMLGAACATVLTSTATGNAFLGVVAGLLSAIFLSVLHALLTQAYRLDHIVSGMAINALALGLSKFLANKYLTGSQSFPLLPIEAFVVLAVAVPLATAMYLKHFRGGLRLFAVGNDPEKCRANGVDPVPIRYWALVVTGILTGLAGAMIVTDAARFGDNVTAGKGFIALAALILAGWRPLPVMLTCIGFGLIDALQLQLQGTKLIGAGVPSEVWNALPYLVTLLGLVIFTGKSRAPAGLGRP